MNSQVKVGSLEFVVWDVSGQDKLRGFWRNFYHGTMGIIFVVDSADVERLETAKVCIAMTESFSCCQELSPPATATAARPSLQEHLHNIMNEEELDGACILVLANKQDSPHALKCEEVAKGAASGGVGVGCTKRN